MSEEASTLVMVLGTRKVSLVITSSIMGVLQAGVDLEMDYDLDK